MVFAECVAALSGTVIGCTSAAIQEGLGKFYFIPSPSTPLMTSPLDPISDVSCLAAAANTILNFVS